MGAVIKFFMFLFGSRSEKKDRPEEDGRPLQDLPRLERYIIHPGVVLPKKEDLKW